MSLTGQSAEIQIRAEPGTDPSVCRFVASREIFPGGSFVCAGPEAARGNGFLEALFAIEGVTQAWVDGSAVILQKLGGADWKTAGKQAGAAIRTFFARGEAFVPPAGAAPGDLAERVRHVLDTQVNPGVAGHGGKIELVELRGRDVYLKMSGGCQGCGAAKLTLKQGVEKTLRAQVPGISEVIDVTDHSAGRAPFYATQPGTRP